MSFTLRIHLVFLLGNLFCCSLFSLHPSGLEPRWTSAWPLCSPTAGEGVWACCQELCLILCLVPPSTCLFLSLEVLPNVGGLFGWHQPCREHMGTCSLAVNGVPTRSPWAPFSWEIPKYAILLGGTQSSGSVSQHMVHPFHLAWPLHLLVVCWVRRLDGGKTRPALMPPWSCLMQMFGVCFRARFLNHL